MLNDFYSIFFNNQSVTQRLLAKGLKTGNQID